MIWIINTCKEQLSKLEFVKPIARLVKERYKVIDLDEIPTGGKVIIAGTALKDFEYFKHIDKLSWIKQYDDAVLGICSGAQIMAKIFGIELVPKKKIGVFEIQANKTIKKAYFLTSFLAKKDVHTIATVDEMAAGFKIGNKYGLFFHPEVLNPEIIENFLEDRCLFE